MNHKLLNISEAAKLLGVSSSTLRRLEHDGVVKAYGLQVIYTPGGQRRYILDDIKNLYTQQGFSGQIGFGTKAALLIRDLTIAFTDPNSKLSIELSGQIEATKKLIDSALVNQIPIIFSITIYDPSHKFSQMWGKKFPLLQVLSSDSTWVKLHPDLSDYTFDLISPTVYINDFFHSSVEEFLNQHQIDTLILAGTTTSGSIKATAVESFQRGYHVIVPEEAVGDRNSAIQSSTLLDLNARYADVLELAHVLKFMNGDKSVNP